MQQARQIGNDELERYELFKKTNGAVSAILDLTCGLKPEVALLVELYEAEKAGRLLTASCVGLDSGIPQTTTIRHVREMAKRGWIARSPHPTDRRVSYLRITPTIYNALDRVFVSKQFPGPAAPLARVRDKPQVVKAA